MERRRHLQVVRLAESAVGPRQEVADGESVEEPVVEALCDHMRRLPVRSAGISWDANASGVILPEAC